MRLDAPARARPPGPWIVGIPKRSRFGELDEGRAIAAACLAARGNVHPCPVIHGSRIVGFVRGESPYSSRVAFEKVPAQYRMAWSTYNDVIVSLGASQRLSRMWSKTHTTSPVGSTWYDLWPVTGIPTAGSLAGAANTAIAYDDTSTGAMYMGGNVSPSIKTILSAWCAGSSTSQSMTTYLLYDRVLDYQSNAYTAAVNQAMTNVAVAGRYAAAGQPGLQMTWATDTVHNATASNITLIDYTDNTGAAAVMPTTPTVGIIVSGAAPTTTLGSRIIAPQFSAASGRINGCFLPLAAGTTGARKVLDYTTSAANTGTFVLALVYPLAYVPTPAADISYIDQVYQISAMERLYDGAAVCVMAYFLNAVGITATGVIDVGWG